MEKHIVFDEFIDRKERTALTEGHFLFSQIAVADCCAWRYFHLGQRQAQEKRTSKIRVNTSCLVYVAAESGGLI